MIRRLRKRFVAIAMAALFLIMSIVLLTVNVLFWHNSMDVSDNLLTYLAENDGGFHPNDTPEEDDDILISDGEEPSGGSVGGGENRAETSAGDSSAKMPGDNRDGPPEKNSDDRDGPPEKPDDKKDGDPGKGPHKGPRHAWEAGFFMSPETSHTTRCFSVMYDAQGNVQSVRTDRIAAVTQSDALAYADKALAGGKTRGMSGVYRYYVEKRGSETFVGFLDCSDLILNIRFLLFISIAIMLFSLGAMWIILHFFSGKAIAPMVENIEKQRRFIADAGHELKTPLTIINADLAVLSMTGGDNEWLDSIKNQTRRLSGLVGELLTLSRMEADPSFKTEEFPLSAAAVEATDAFRTLAANQNKIFKTDIQPDITYRGEEAALRRLISVLMDNAVKYTPEGGNILFTLKKNGHGILIEATNTCAPIDKKDLAHLFDRFYRVDSARTQSSGGYGMGLSIALEIVKLHHGKIRAHCPAPGTITFAITLPVCVKH